MKIEQILRLTTISAMSTILIGCATFVSTNTAKEFAIFLEQVDNAQLELQQGKPDSYKALWSHRADVTLAGGFGGTIEQGWEHVAKRLDWASSQFVKGRNEIHRIGFASSGNIGYLIQTEHLVFNTPDRAAVAERTYRVTMLFRREERAWRIIHRHADSQTVKEQPR